jgi:hypothetical protein
VLDMGSHSVKPWIMPRIIVCRGFMSDSPFLVGGLLGVRL